MAQSNVSVPNLPKASKEYDAHYADQYTSILRLFFLQLTNPGPMSGTALNLDIARLPKDTDFAALRSGDVYYDTSGGVATSYPLRIKA